ncbi:hypothetical protein ABZ454_10895 [Streptomyces sp. NPDC005803]|uniref:hypothetical protein n=1 Tax=Streptomyces sp. NPDC005803 TaxID=3154297 RepID=UPI0033E56445
MHSRAFPWMARLTDEEAYEFIGEVIQAAQAAGTHTGFLRFLDERVAVWAATTEALAQQGISE